MQDFNQRPIILTLADRTFLLVRQIGTGQKTIVWKAWMMQPEVSIEKQFPQAPNSLAWLLAAHPEYETERALPEGLPGKWVAIKVPRSGCESDMRKEAWQLKRLGGKGQRGGARAIGVELDRADDPNLPVLVLEWASGISVNDVPPLEEVEGIRLASQLVHFIQTASIYRLILTDTLKPGSLFYDEDTRSLILLDWNTMGTKPQDMRAITLPVLGQTLYRLFTGYLIEFPLGGRAFDVSGKQIGAGSAADRWDGLSFGTRQLITDLLLKRIPGTNAEEIVQNLVHRVNTQQERVRIEPVRLLSGARQATDPIHVLNDYDLARSGGETLTQEDEERYLENTRLALHNIPLTAPELAWAIANWASRKYPKDITIRWIWLVRQSVQEDPKLWKQLEPIFDQVGQFENVLDIVYPRMSDSPAVKLIAVEAQLRRDLAGWRERPTKENVEAFQKFLLNLKDIWQGNDFSQAYGDVWLIELEEALVSLQNKIHVIQDVHSKIKDRLDNDQLPETTDVYELLRVEPSEELGVLYRSLARLEKGEVKEARHLWAESRKVIGEDPLLSGLAEAVNAKINDLTQDARSMVRHQSAPFGSCLEDWNVVEDQEDLPGLMEANDLLKGNELSACINKLFTPGFPSTSDQLIGYVWEALCQEVVQQVKAYVYDLTSAPQDRWNTERGKLTRELAKRLKDTELVDDLEVKLLGRLVEHIEKASQSIDTFPSNALHIVAQKIPHELTTSQLDDSIYKQVKHWVDVLVKQLVTDELHKEAQNRISEAEKRLDPTDEKEIQVAVREIIALLQQADQFHPEDAKASHYIQAVKDFRTGRAILLRGQQGLETAQERFEQAIGSEWQKLNTLTYPYLALTRAELVLYSLSNNHTIPDLIKSIKRCDEIGETLGQLDNTLLVQWNETVILERIDTSVQRAKDIGRTAKGRLNTLLQEWQNDLFNDDSTIQEWNVLKNWLDLLSEIEVENMSGSLQVEPSAHTNIRYSDSDIAYEQSLTVSRQSLETLYYKALTRSEIKRAVSNFRDGRHEQAERNIAQAQKYFAESNKTESESAWPNGQPANVVVVNEIEHQRRQIWEQIYARAARGYSIAAGLQEVNQYRGLLDKIEINEHAGKVPENAFEDLLEASESVTERQEWATALESVTLTSALSALCAWANVARLIERGRECEALELKDLTTQFHPDGMWHVEEAIVERGREYGVQLYNLLLQRPRRRAKEYVVPAPSPELEALDTREGIGTFARHTEDLTLDKKEAFRDKFAKEPVANWQELGIAIAQRKQRNRMTRRVIAAVIVPVALLGLVLAFLFMPSLQGWWQNITNGMRERTAMELRPFLDIPSSPPFGWAGTVEVRETVLQGEGAEVRHEIVIHNTGELSGTFWLEVTPANVPVRWLHEAGDEGPRVALASQETAVFILVVERSRPSRQEPIVGLNLMVDGLDTPLAMAPLQPATEQLEIVFDMPDEEWVQGVKEIAKGWYTASVGSEFQFACYDGIGERVVVSTTVLENQSGEFVCPLAGGAVGDWHVAIFPSLGPTTPSHRPSEGFYYETAFPVREPHYEVGVSDQPVLSFDPNSEEVEVGYLYALWNAGEDHDRFAVAVTPTQNVQTVTLSLSLLDGITPTSILTGSLIVTDVVTIYPSESERFVLPEAFTLAPCTDPWSDEPECPILRMAVVLRGTQPPSEEGPWHVEFALFPQEGRGQRQSLTTEVTRVPEQELPPWLYVDSP